MALKLMLKQFGGPEIASITQSPDGKLQVHAFTAGLQGEIENLVWRVDQKPLRLIGGSTKVENQQRVEITTGRQVPQSDPDYLRALAGALSAPFCTIQGKRVRAYIIES